MRSVLYTFGSVPRLPAALLISTSRRRNFRRNSCANSRTDAWLEVSICITINFNEPVRRVISEAVLFPFLTSRQPRIISAPRAANRIAASFPTPEVGPVMTTRLPFIEFIKMLLRPPRCLDSGGGSRVNICEILSRFSFPNIPHLPSFSTTGQGGTYLHPDRVAGLP